MELLNEDMRSLKAVGKCEVSRVLALPGWLKASSEVVDSSLVLNVYLLQTGSDGALLPLHHG